MINQKFLESYLGINITKHLSEIRKLHVPLTGAHGDLHQENIILDKNHKLKFIDWRNYRNKNSLIYDLLHLKVRELCNEYNLSWTEIILKKHLYLLVYIPVEFTKYKKQLLIFYSLIG